MKAMVYTRYGPPEVVQLAEVPTPTPKENEVRVRIKAAVVSRGDCAARRGSPVSIRLATGLVRPKKPILGSTLAGEIDAGGTAVTRFKPGDQVYAATGAGFGAHAEYRCLLEDGALAAKPANATDAEAAAICEGGLTALPFLRDHGKIQPGHHVLINGASGAVGASAVQLAKAFGGSSPESAVQPMGTSSGRWAPIWSLITTRRTSPKLARPTTSSSTCSVPGPCCSTTTTRGVPTR